MSDYPTVDLGSLCVYCGTDTAVSGFVNRIPADTTTVIDMPVVAVGERRRRFVDIRVEGYMCPYCQNSDDAIEDCLLEAYDKSGSLGVWVWCEDNHPEWVKSRCEPCEDITHTWKHICSVCWSEKNDKEV